MLQIVQMFGILIWLKIISVQINHYVHKLNTIHILHKVIVLNAWIRVDLILLIIHMFGIKMEILNNAQQKYHVLIYSLVNNILSLITMNVKKIHV